tara:strand:+ start:736802 stop:738355 length:1554 start_codon:yes stop_codon:yes gene_type:complete
LNVFDLAFFNTETIDSSNNLYSVDNKSILFNINSSQLNLKGFDSLRVRKLQETIKRTYKEENWNAFNESRLELITLTKKLKDSFSLAKALEYSGAYHRKHTKLDSAYYYFYQSYKIYRNLNDSLKAGRLLVNIAILKENIRDYQGSERTSFQAISFLKSSNNLRRISSMYNNLGIVYDEMGDVANSIKYHSKALEYRTAMSNPIYAAHSLNNIGKTYKNNKEYAKAISYFKEALEYESALKNSPKVKATILDNYIHAEFSNGVTTGIIDRAMEVLRLREEHDDKNGIIISCIHLSEYFNVLGQREKAIDFAKRAEKISLKTQNFRDYMASLELMSSMYNTSEAKEHFKKYISVRDSLDKVARTYKNQFDRIEFETNEKETTINEQSKELKKNKDLILIIFLCLFLSVVSLVTFYVWKKRKKKKLQKTLLKGFENYLKEKYGLSNQNFEYWKIWVEEHGQEIISQKLFISIDALKSRRRSLKNKVANIGEITGDFDQAKAIKLFNKELEFYKNQIDLA